jgi:hypothetical protein
MRLLTLFAALPLAHSLPCQPHPSHPELWQSLASIPKYPRQEHTTLALSATTLAILGGIVPSGAQFATTPLLQLYDIPTDTWRDAAPMPLALNRT